MFEKLLKKCKAWKDAEERIEKAEKEIELLKRCVEGLSVQIACHVKTLKEISEEEERLKKEREQQKNIEQIIDEWLNGEEGGNG